MNLLAESIDIENQKKDLIKEIDDEIQREYSSLNKFTTEKFSIVLLILGIIGLGITIWQTVHPNISLTEFLSLWICSTFVLVLFWMYKIYDTLITSFKGKPNQTNTMIFIQKKFQELIGEFQKIKNIDKNDISKNEGELKELYSKISNYLCVNIDYVAKNMETRMRPISLLFIFLLFVGIIDYEHFFGVAIPTLQQTVPFLSLHLFWLILLYAILFIILGY